MAVCCSASELWARGTRVCELGLKRQGQRVPLQAAQLVPMPCATQDSPAGGRARSGFMEEGPPQTRDQCSAGGHVCVCACLYAQWVAQKHMINAWLVVLRVCAHLCSGSSVST